MPSGLDALADQEVRANIQRALRTVNRSDLNAVACAVRSHEGDLFSSGYSPGECNNANPGLKSTPQRFGLESQDKIDLKEFLRSFLNFCNRTLRVLQGCPSERERAQPSGLTHGRGQFRSRGAAHRRLKNRKA